jgi:Rrf2 family cysteine metabolism transcriptional repressor
MKMTTKGKYAVSTMCELAGAYSGDRGKYLQAKDIAGRHFLSEMYAEQILNMLKRSSLVKAVRGPQGGYILARPPRMIKIGEILEATEGPISLVQCITSDKKGICRLSLKCKTKKFWSKLNRVIQRVLDETTLDDLC